MVYENSDDDEDDVYTNSAARLKALKAKKSIAKTARKIIIKDISEETAVQDQNINSAIILNHSPVTSEPPFYETASRTRGAATIPLNRNKMCSPLITIDLDASMPSPILTEIDDSSDAQSFSEKVDCNSGIPNVIENDYMMNVKVRWRSREIERVKLGMNEKFAKIFQYFSLLENVPENQILLTRKDIPINQTDTPSSISLQIIDILEGGIIDTTFANNSNNSEPMCKIKIQSCSSMKNFLTYKLGKNQPFKKLVEYCSNEKNVSSSKIKLFFDGELVSLSDTPACLDLDDEACFDLQFIE